MKLATQTERLSNIFGDERAIEIIKDAGFNAIDFSLFSMAKDNNVFNTEDYKTCAQRLKDIATDKGIYFNQSHAPFHFDWSNERAPKSFIAKIIRSIEVSSILGARQVVIHPIHHLVYVKNEQKMREINMNFYKSLIPYCKEFNIKIAIENMYQMDSLRKYLVDDVCPRATELASYVDELNSACDCFVACLDLGHSGLVGESAQEAITILGKDRLKALHVHDNNYKADNHTIPGLGCMNWNEITTALSSIGYDGEFTLEADNFLNGFEKALIPTAVRFMHDVGRYWANKVV